MACLTGVLTNVTSTWILYHSVLVFIVFRKPSLLFCFLCIWANSFLCCVVLFKTHFNKLLCASAEHSFTGWNSFNKWTRNEKEVKFVKYYLLTFWFFIYHLFRVDLGFDPMWVNFRGGIFFSSFYFSLALFLHLKLEEKCWEI